jgi:hypothetical protein
MTIAEFECFDIGISWTLSKKVAEFFAYKYLRNFSTEKLPKMVHSEIVNKKNLLCYLNGRKEQEVLLF